MAALLECWRESTAHGERRCGRHEVCRVAETGGRRVASPPSSVSRNELGRAGGALDDGIA